MALLATVAASATRGSSALTSGAPKALAQVQATVDGYTAAFTTGSIVMAAAAVLMAVGLSITKEELSPETPV